MMKSYLGNDEKTLMDNIVQHLEYTLAKTRFSLDQKHCFLAAALSMRDRLIEVWNDAQIKITHLNPKRIYYLSIEYLIGRSFANSLLNLNMEEAMTNALR